MRGLRSRQSQSVSASNLGAEVEPATLALNQPAVDEDTAHVHRHRPAVGDFQTARDIRWCDEHAERTQGVVERSGDHPALHGTVGVQVALADRKAGGQGPGIHVDGDELAGHGREHGRRYGVLIDTVAQSGL